MLLIALAYLGGVLTIVSPCILPVLPFVFARADQPFAKSGLPLLAGMALTFALVASLAAVGGGWVVAAKSGSLVPARARWRCRCWTSWPPWACGLTATPSSICRARCVRASSSGW